MNSYGYSHHHNYYLQHSHNNGYDDIAIGYHDQIPIQPYSPRHRRRRDQSSSCPIMCPQPVRPTSGSHILGANYDSTLNNNTDTAMPQRDSVPRYRIRSTDLNNFAATTSITAAGALVDADHHHHPSNTSDYHSASCSDDIHAGAYAAEEFANWDGQANFEVDDEGMKGPKRYPVDMYLFNRMLQDDNEHDYHHDEGLEVPSSVVNRHPTPGPQVLRTHGMYAHDNGPVSTGAVDRKEGVVENSPAPKRRHSTKMAVVGTLKRVLSVVKRHKEGTTPAKNTMTMKSEQRQQQQQQQNNGDGGEGRTEAEPKKIGRSRTWNVGDKVSVIQTDTGLTPMTVNHVKRCLWCQNRTIDGGKLGGGM